MVSVLFQVIPLYVAEISPEKLRGRLQSFITIYGTMGGLVSSLVLKVAYSKTAHCMCSQG